MDIECHARLIIKCKSLQTWWNVMSAKLKFKKRKIVWAKKQKKWGKKKISSFGAKTKIVVEIYVKNAVTESFSKINRIFCLKKATKHLITWPSHLQTILTKLKKVVTRNKRMSSTK